MDNRGPLSALRFISVALLLMSILLTVLQLIWFSRVRAYMPAGLKIAGVPVGGLDRQQSAQRILEAYSMPLELRYKDQIILLEPAVVDFQVDIERMLAAAELERTQKLFWVDFWDYLWGRTTFPTEIPLSIASFSEARLRTFLNEVSERYDQSPVAASPVAGSVEFKPGVTGVSLDVDGAVMLIESALSSISDRTVNLPLKTSQPSRPAFKNLEVLLRQTIKTSGFDGLAGIYLMDLQTSQELHFAVMKDQVLPVEPDIAFTASSIIKVPIMVSVFHRLGADPDEETLKLLSDMVDKSGNESADWLMNRVIDSKRAPLEVTKDMQALGLKILFLAGYFSRGSPLLETIKTPANERSDIDTDPDPYSQTTPSDIGMLLEDIYQCSQTGGGTLVAVYGGQMSQSKCQTMNNYLLNNRLAVLLTAGLPEGTQIAHKHGWVSTNGIINTVGDAGIIYTPGGNYIFVVFLHHPDQLIWDPASELIAQLSQAVYTITIYHPNNEKREAGYLLQASPATNTPLPFY